MMGDLLEVGDEVTITVDNESREWCNHPPDGTKARVVGFGEMHWSRICNFGIKPGFYLNRCYVKLILESGQEHTEYYDHLKFVDKQKEARRVAEFRKQSENRNNNWRYERDFLRDLPETPFWEGDKVRLRDQVESSTIATVFSVILPQGHNPHEFMITVINYDHLTKFTEDGRKFPAYDISYGFGLGLCTSENEDEIELVERGKVWKFYHNEQIVFSNLKEEANFFAMLGHTEDIRNPATSDYAWTKEEVLDAIRSGLVHGFKMSGSGEESWISAMRFRNEELGRRVAKATLEGFNVTLA